MRRVRLGTAAASGLVVAVLSLAGGARHGPAGHVQAQAARAVTVDSGPLQPGSTATVRWEGFTPNSPAYVYVCQGTPSGLPRPQACYGETLQSAQTGPDGRGSATFRVRSALHPLTYNIGGPKFPGGDFGTDCRTINGCEVVVTECSSVVSAEMSAAGSYAVPPAAWGTYDDDPLTRVVWGEDWDGDGEPDEQTLLARQLPPPEEPPREEPIRATGPRIRANGSDLGGAVHREWGRAIAQRLNITLTSTTAVDFTAGISDLVRGSADFAYTAAPASPDQLAQLTRQRQSIVYVPISVSAVGIGYNVYPLLPMRDLRVSPMSLAALLWPGGQAGSTVSSGALGADQGRCRPPVSRESVLLGEGGHSEALLSISSMLDGIWRSRTAPPPPPWRYGIIDRAPSDLSLYQPMPSHELVAAGVSDPRQSGQTSLDFAARLGILDAAWAREFGVPMAYMQNENGQWVLPSAEGALATLADSTIGSDNIVDVNELSDDPEAYPLVVVNYAVAPVRLTADFTATDADAVRRSLEFMVSSEGQRIARSEGFVPLTHDLTVRATRAIAKIGSQPQVRPAPPSTTTTTSTTPTSAPRRPPTSTTVPRRPTSTSTSSSTSTSFPSSFTPSPGSGPGSPPGFGSTPSTGSGFSPGGSGPNAGGGGGPGANPSTTGTGQEPGFAGAPTLPEDLPADVFRSLLEKAPSAPELPALGAAGATAAVAGQGLNLWRIGRRRPPRPGL